MQRFVKNAWLALTVMGMAVSASAFSLLGPYDTWQSQGAGGIGYGLGGDIGGPMNLGQEYRWNIRTVTYGFTPEFWNYFGAHGTAAVMQAMAVLNNLKPFSQMSTNLTEFPLDTRRVNYQASALGLLDMKTLTLATMVEEMGLASPDRYVWTLHARVVVGNVTNYYVVMRNFDPVALTPSMYVNGTFYTYDVLELPIAGGTYSDAVENTDIDPLAPTETAVASMVDDNSIRALVLAGSFLTGLTRDDVAGLRYIYDGNWFGRAYANVNTETLIPGTLAGNPPWMPIGATNVPADQALRPGVDHITFKLYPSSFGFYDSWNVVTQQYTDTFSTNGTVQTQTTERGLTDGAGNGLPDIIFDAQDIFDAANVPFLLGRTDTTAPIWVNNTALNNPGVTSAGPGQINGPVVITFGTAGPYFLNDPVFFRGPPGAGSSSIVWGSFDGTTNAPIIYPAPGNSATGISVQERLQQLQNYGF